MHRRGTRSGDPIAPLFIAIAVALTAIAAAPSRVAAVPGAMPQPGATVTFYGRGYGHGLGLSQYGARGRALAGQTAPQILAQYYQNTTLGAIDPTTPIRILVVDGFTPTAARPAKVVAHGGTWTVDGLPGTWPAEASATMTPSAGPTVTWQLTIAAADGTVLATAPVGPSVRIQPSATTTVLQVWFKPSYYDTYRGAILLIGSTGGSVTAIDETTLDTYLLGVVTCEMPASWPSEALNAQAIAARSFAAAHLHPASGTWDVYDDTRSQVYRGVFGESAQAQAAVTATAGQVLMSGSTVVMALFHSSDGGATENNENVYVSDAGTVYGQPISYLRGSPDRAPDGSAYDATSPQASWQTATYTNDQLSAVFGADPRTNVGTLASLDLSNRGVSGRLISVTLSGSLGMQTVSGEIFRTVFNRYTPATDPYMWSTLVATSPLPDVCPPGPQPAVGMPTLAGCAIVAGAPGTTPTPTPTPTTSPGQPTPTPTTSPGQPPLGQEPPAVVTVSSPSTAIALTTSAPVITWSSGITLTVQFVGSGANRAFALQGTRDGVAWSTIANLVTDASGRASLAYRPATNLYYRVVFGGAADLPAAVSATVRTVVRQIALLRPTTYGRVSSAVRNAPVSFTTTVRPARPELAPATISYRIERFLGGRWSLYATRSVVADAAGLARLTWQFNLPGLWAVSSAANPTPYNANSFPTPRELYQVR
ncbi:MAG: SpoIID/LytB domain-containing protein [Chloroflexi bacterium]|nr:SpoIID/LytB domain-containing protein [Chloroflexota bacterium]